MSRNYSEFLSSFERCDIDAKAFGHVDHIGVGYEMLRKYEFLDACLKYSNCINSIATKAGAADKFNVTITLAFLSLIAERMQSSSYASFDSFIDENSDLLSGNPLAKWYTKERLGSELAQLVFLMPDKAA